MIFAIFVFTSSKNSVKFCSSILGITIFYELYAIIDTGNQQERVEVGTVIEVDYIADAKKGDKVKFDKVLLLSDGKTPHVGQPHVKKAYVSGKVVSQDKKDKVYAIQFRRRKDSKRIVGHRRKVTTINIEEIKNGS